MYNYIMHSPLIRVLQNFSVHIAFVTCTCCALIRIFITWLTLRYVTCTMPFSSLIECVQDHVMCHVSV